jgi:hypothetical protein
MLYFTDIHITHGHTHTRCTHTHTHTHTHTRVHTMYMCLYIEMCAHMHTYIHTYIHAYMYEHTHTHTFRFASKLTRASIHTHTHTLSLSLSLSLFSVMCARIETNRHAHRKCMRIYTTLLNMYVYMYISSSVHASMINLQHANRQPCMHMCAFVYILCSRVCMHNRT